MFKSHTRDLRLIAAALLACVGATLAAAGPASARVKPSAATVTAPVAAPATPPPTTGISVAGNQLMLNGAPFVPRGVQITGLVAPTDQLWGKYVAANQVFGAPELQQAIADGANLVRIQVSEFGLNPADPLYEASYVQEVQQGVELARSLGLYVIVSLQAENPAGNETRCSLPDAGAATDWAELASMFAGDDGVMFELYNEPALGTNASNWQTWLNGGPTTTNSVPAMPCTAVGVQALVDEIRAAGASNVIILPGLAAETSLSGVPAVTDPTYPTDPQLAYGIHYPALTLTPSAWDTEFGNLAKTKPVIVTEWGANSTTNCAPNSPTSAPLLLDYLASKQIGVVGFAFDELGTMISNFNFAPTTYNGFQCGTGGTGAGALLFGDFAGEAAQQADSGDEAPRAWVLGVSVAARLAALNDSLTTSALNTPRTFVQNGSAGSLQALGLGSTVPTATFTSEAALSQAALSGTLQPGTEAVELVLGSGSPAAERSNPSETFQAAALVAHSEDLLFVAAPQLALMRNVTPHASRANWDVEFLRKRIAVDAARNADAIVLPFSETQGDGLFAGVAAQQVATIRRSIEVIGSLNTTSAPSSQQIAPRIASQLSSSSSGLAGFNLTDANGAGDTAALAVLQSLYPQAPAAS